MKLGDTMRLAHVPLYFVLALFAGGCATFAIHQLDQTYGPEEVRDRMVSHNDNASRRWLEDVQPIIASRCAVCHGCYDAPCQLNLASPAGIDRGASTEKVYSGARFREAKPSRIFEDAQDTVKWREAGFYPVLNERDQNPAANLNASVMGLLLSQKLAHPLPDQAILPASFDLSLDRKQQCPKIENMDRYTKRFPLWGMPYGLPRLPAQELATLQTWLANGAPMADKPPLKGPWIEEITRWETFLNGDSLKQQLMARYLYEHWFLAHLYFDQLPPGEFFKLVRSRTPPGQTIDRIVSRRPYDDPGVDRVYYRMWREKSVILDKTHMPYRLSDKRMEKFTAWFLDADFSVTSLPSYEPRVGANPFIAYQDIPVASRWRFLLEEAQFTIMNFIKGPVCRGQVALNVINDHFWVFFITPTIEDKLEGEHFLAGQQDHLRIPVEAGSNAAPLKTWSTYSKAQEKYLKAKTDEIERVLRDGEHLTLDVVWDGDGENQNASLTVFRHNDSASVVQGMVGSSPKTAWLIDYALLERIHYLLVAGFDVYGNLGHQLNTRLYMDFLRMEGEFNFLALLPNQTRAELREYWYRGASERERSYIFGSRAQLHEASSIEYRTSNPKEELLGMIKEYLAPVLPDNYSLNNKQVPDRHRLQLQRLEQLNGLPAALLPEVVFLTVDDESGKLWPYTVLHNNAHANITSLFGEAGNRLPAEDDVTVVRGYIGAYPSAFWHVTEDRLSHLVDAAMQLEDEGSYTRLMDGYGVRRTDPAFWQHSDRLMSSYHSLEPVTGGLFDFNRLENR